VAASGQQYFWQAPDLTGAASRADSAPAELSALTSLRGIAAMVVLLFHCSFFALRFADGEPPGFWLRGYLGVDLFFLLSGFVLTHVYAGRLAGERNWRAIGKFLWARFCRIYPASLFTIAVIALQHAIGTLHLSPEVSIKNQLIAALLLMQVPWLDTIVLNSPAWSISAEWYAYMLFPFVVPLICRLRGRTAALVCVALLIEIAADHSFFTHDEQLRGWGALVRALPEFTVGILAYRAYRERLFRAIWERDATLIAVVAMIVGACVAGISDAPIVILLLAVLLASVSNSGRVAGVLNAKPLRWLGEVSYPVYIFQMVPLMFAATISEELVAHGLYGVRFQAFAFFLALGCGALVHRCVDQPVRAALRRLPDRMIALAATQREANSGRNAETGVVPVLPPVGPRPQREA
jgi:peptidoglycan/LPS O-acetylase OafA/YrhL